MKPGCGRQGVAELRRERVERERASALPAKCVVSGFYQTTKFHNEDDEESVLQHGVNIHVFVACNLES